jgi:dephospho-CoA kinase
MIVGLTGGIGSGKSTVARLFELLGCLVFESDKVAKALYFDPEIKKQVIALLGKESYLSETRINTAFISAKIFSDPELLKQINALIHPAVIAASRRFAEENPDKIVIKETALLFEAGLEKEVDKIVLVTADEQTRIQRVTERDKQSEEEVRKKIKNQMPEELKLKKADHVIYNDEKELVIPQVINVFEALSRA